MPLKDHLEARASALLVNVELAPGIVWKVQLRSISPADLVLEGGDMWGLFAEAEVVKTLTGINEETDAEAKAKALQAMGVAVLARRATEPPHSKRDRSTKIYTNSVLAVCLAVVAIDTQDDDTGLEAVNLVPTANKVKGVQDIHIDALPPEFVNALMPHVMRTSTNGSREVAEVMARFRDDPKGAADSVHQRAPEHADSEGALDVVE